MSFQINHDFVQRLVVQSDNCENVQIGSHNTQVVHNHCDVSLIKDVISQLENSIKEVNEKRKLMEVLMQDVTSQFKVIFFVRIVLITFLKLISSF
jgi:hypothetical protein